MEQDKDIIKYAEPENNEVNDEKLHHLNDLFGLLTTRTTVPTYVPKRFIQQLVVVNTGASQSLYVYDKVGGLWRGTTLGT